MLSNFARIVLLTLVALSGKTGERLLLTLNSYYSRFLRTVFFYSKRLVTVGAF